MSCSNTTVPDLPNRNASLGTLWLCCPYPVLLRLTWGEFGTDSRPLLDAVKTPSSFTAARVIRVDKHGERGCRTPTSSACHGLRGLRDVWDGHETGAGQVHGEG